MSVHSPLPAIDAKEDGKEDDRKDEEEAGKEEEEAGNEAGKEVEEEQTQPALGQPFESNPRWVPWQPAGQRP